MQTQSASLPPPHCQKSASARKSAGAQERWQQGLLFSRDFSSLLRPGGGQICLVPGQISPLLTRAGKVGSTTVESPFAGRRRSFLALQVGCGRIRHYADRI